MIGETPKFLDSPFFVDEPGNWHLKPGAPDETVKEFEAFTKTMTKLSNEEKPGR